MSSDRIPVVPGVLEWARLSSGLTIAAAAKKLTIGEQTLQRWEAGESPPTIKQLRKAGKVYGRPLAVLLLPTPPRDYQPIRDFRTGWDGMPVTWSPPLHKEMKRAFSQREVVLEIAEIAPATVPESILLPTISRDLSPEAAADSLRVWLSLDDLPKSLWSQPFRLLNTVVKAVEELGILIIQTQGIEIQEMRGFSFAEQPYSVIALNGKDWPRPRLFTLLHELCHIATNLSGICDLHETQNVTMERDDIEDYCNRVAAAVLVPRDRVLAVEKVVLAQSTTRWTLEELESLSRPFGSSSEAMLLRLISLGKADWDTYRVRKPEFEQEYEVARQREKGRRKAAKGGPSYYTVKARDLGHGYISSVLDAYAQKAISSLDAADYLEVRYDQIPKLEEAAR